MSLPRLMRAAMSTTIVDFPRPGSPSRRVSLPLGSHPDQSHSIDSGSMSEPGLHKATWNLTQLALRPGLSRYSPSGTYRVVLVVDGKEHVQPLRVEVDPVLQQATGAEQAGPWRE